MLRVSSEVTTYKPRINRKIWASNPSRSYSPGTLNEQLKEIYEHFGESFLWEKYSLPVVSYKREHTFLYKDTTLGNCVNREHHSDLVRDDLGLENADF